MAKIPNLPRTSAFQQQLKTVETVISTDGLSQDLEGTLNQNKLENVTTVLQATASYLQKAPGKNTYASRFSQISSLALFLKNFSSPSAAGGHENLPPENYIPAGADNKRRT